jgi:uncharacterized protein with ATP-grasp and redox domains
MDPSHLPPRISTGDSGTFAEKTLEVRLPQQVDQLLAQGSRGPDDGAHSRPDGHGEAALPRSDRRGEAVRSRSDGRAAAALPPDTRERLLSLKRRLAGGVVRDLLRDQPEVPKGMAVGERSDWERSIAAHLGRPWSDIPWYFAESLFYLEILAAWGWYTPGSPGFRRDPFEPQKLEELSRHNGGIARVEKVLRNTASFPDAADHLAALMRHALWGNRMDLTFGELVRRYGSGSLGENEELLVDHSGSLARRALEARRVDLVLDNAGTELACDLVLANDLLAHGVRVVMHVKDSPFYVSDAMAKDVQATAAALSSRGEPETARVGRELRDSLADGSLTLRPHWFWNGPLLYPQWPEEIRGELASSDLVVFKGDVNYRRLLDDRRWAHDTPMEELTAYVPVPFGVLRTLKSEVVVDLPRSTVAALAWEDPDWSVCGRYGMARLRA